MAGIGWQRACCSMLLGGALCGCVGAGKSSPEKSPPARQSDVNSLSTGPMDVDRATLLESLDALVVRTGRVQDSFAIMAFTHNSPEGIDPLLSMRGSGDVPLVESILMGIASATSAELAILPGRVSFRMTPSTTYCKELGIPSLPDVYCLPDEVRINPSALIFWFSKRGVVLHDIGRVVQTGDGPTVWGYRSEGDRARAVLLLYARGYDIVFSQWQVAGYQHSQVTGEWERVELSLAPYSLHSCVAVDYNFEDRNQRSGPFGFLFEPIHFAAGRYRLKEVLSVIDDALVERGHRVAIQFLDDGGGRTNWLCYVKGRCRIAHILSEFGESDYANIELWPRKVLVNRSTVYSPPTGSFTLRIAPFSHATQYLGRRDWVNITEWFVQRGVFFAGQGGAWLDPATHEAIIVAPETEADLAREVAIFYGRGYAVVRRDGQQLEEMGTKK